MSSRQRLAWTQTKMTQQNLILNELKDHPEGVYNFEFANKFHILRYSARIFDLRKRGWDIREDFSGHYILHTEPQQLNFI